MKDAYIFDIDGTLALKCDRSPFDYTKVSNDLPNIPVITTLRVIYKGCYEIIITSGREDSCEADTREWLERHLGLKGFKLFMRKTGDMRNDAIVKQEIFDTHIRPHYNVVAVFDDRNRVVDKWREMGIPCFQVAEGDF